MGQPNLVSLNIPEAELTEIKDAINVLITKLLPHLKTLSPEERQELPKMGMKTMGFVQKGVEHCQQNPELVPAYLNVEELVNDYKAVELDPLHVSAAVTSDRRPRGHDDFGGQRSP